MKKRRIGRKKKPAGSGKLDLEKKILKILGEPPAGSLVKETLEGKPRAKILSASRLLGLRGIARLRKDELVDRLWHALHGDARPPTKEKASHTTPPVEPASEEHAGRSRAEFEAHKYSLTGVEASSTGPRESSAPAALPWSYGRDRVRALAIDPERLYVYWEVADEARERARARLEAGASSAWLSLRVYDTTGRLFDGTNAHSYFDHRVENGSRQRVFDIGKAGSEAFVEIGMKSHEGYFVRIARSGRVVFPRRSPAPYREPQWLTVRAEPEAPAAFESASHRSTSFPPGPAPRQAHVPLEPPEIEPAVHRTEPHPIPPIPVELRGEREIEKGRDAGSIPLLLNLSEPVSESGGGEVSTFEVDGRAHVVFGPWQVVVRGAGAAEASGGGRVLSRWMVYRSWAVEHGSELPLEAMGERHGGMLGSPALFGGSERLLRGASELRFAGASELLYRGASERRLGGASERVYGAASERLLRGASERRYKAAGEKVLGGASGRR